MAVGNEAWRFDGKLGIHAEQDDVEKHLQHRLALDIATRRTKSHKGLAILENQSRIRSQPGALPGLDRACMAGISPGLRPS